MEDWQRIPSVQKLQVSPRDLARTLERVTGRQIIIRPFDVFRADFAGHAKSPPELYPYGVLTTLFPLCIAAVLDGSEKVLPKDDPLALLIRPFDGCKHVLMALYDWHPVHDSPWNDGLWDHVRMWTWKHCEVCEGIELKAKGLQ
jgi:hypothetical protein